MLLSGRMWWTRHPAARRLRATKRSTGWLLWPMLHSSPGVASSGMVAAFPPAVEPILTHMTFVYDIRYKRALSIRERGAEGKRAQQCGLSAFAGPCVVKKAVS